MRQSEGSGSKRSDARAVVESNAESVNPAAGAD